MGRFFNLSLAQGIHGFEQRLDLSHRAAQRLPNAD
jgi:hypothetical protein